MSGNEYFLLEQGENNYKLILLNIWDKDNLSDIIKKIDASNLPKDISLVIDFKNLKECDSSAIIYLISFFENFKEENLIFENFDFIENKFNFYKNGKMFHEMTGNKFIHTKIKDIKKELEKKEKELDKND